MFKKILIANRGEIACRVIESARRLGIASVAVYSDADRDSLHVERADEAYRLGPAPAFESYLKSDLIIEIARRACVEAIHPGYGFLSENAEFAEACAKAGIVFIGPPAAAIRAMGEKDKAKQLMEEAGVPVVPGYHGAEQDDASLRRAAGALGYPLLIKAALGGGGKGMRLVEREEAFDEALASARREALAAFGNDRVLIERYLQKPRHIEVQVFADGKGQALHLFERDCSLQRRHQKVLEEAPAPGMPDAMREAMGKAAVAAAKAIGYSGAGTVEFIADAFGGLDAESFYFMEMNTRLQVEHPVTELITGEDLVEWQLRVAAGESMPFQAQDEIAAFGHAVEVRLYAEDPATGFLPATGRISHLRLPEEVEAIRIDSGIREGDAITPFYDPMIAKIISWGEDRSTALSRLAAALDELELEGLKTNLSFLRQLIRQKSFLEASHDTGLIERVLPELTQEPEMSEEALAAAVFYQLNPAVPISRRADPFSPWAACQGWRSWGGARQFAHVTFAGETLEVPVTFRRDGALDLDLPSGPLRLRCLWREDSRLLLDFGDHVLPCSIVGGDEGVSVFLRGGRYRFALPDLFEAETKGEAGDDRIISPLPGRIAKLNSSVGKKVSAGEPLIVIEAMKMEHSLTAPREGTVVEVLAGEGDQVEEGSLLVVLAQAEAEE